MPTTKKQLRQRILDVASPLVPAGERVQRVAEILKGPKTIWPALLGPVGFFFFERPRYLVLTARSLLVVVPPGRQRGDGRLEAAHARASVSVASYEELTIWTRLLLRVPGGTLGCNFSRVWKEDAEILRRTLS